MSETIEPWKNIRSQRIFSHPRINLVEDTVMLPNGEQRDWLRFDGYPNYVEIIAMNAEGKVLVQRQYCHPPARVVHEFPGGLIDAGEARDVAAGRELEEEAGLKAGRLIYLGSYLVMRRRSDHQGHVFLALDLAEGMAAPEPDEIILSEWLTPAEIDAAILAGRFESKTLIADWMYFKLNEAKLRAEGVLPATDANGDRNEFKP